MALHPYRTPQEAPDAVTSARDADDALEERVVELVLFVVGLLGVVVGIAQPASAFELTVGTCLLVLALHLLAAPAMVRGGSSRPPRRASGP